MQVSALNDTSLSEAKLCVQSGANDIGSINSSYLESDALVLKEFLACTANAIRSPNDFDLVRGLSFDSLGWLSGRLPHRIVSCCLKQLGLDCGTRARGLRIERGDLQHVQSHLVSSFDLCMFWCFEVSTRVALGC